MPYHKCPRCLKPLPAEAGFCRRCGLVQKRVIDEPQVKRAPRPARSCGGAGPMRLMLLLIVISFVVRMTSRHGSMSCPREGWQDENFTTSPSVRQWHAASYRNVRIERYEQEQPGYF